MVTMINKKIIKYRISQQVITIRRICLVVYNEDESVIREVANDSEAQ